MRSTPALHWQALASHRPTGLPAAGGKPPAYRLAGCWLLVSIILGLFAVMVQPASASFHLMQIEQVIGGVNGDTSAQAIQLRSRFPGENLLSFARLRVWDSSGANPITLTDFDADLPPNEAGSRILLASPNFMGYLDTPLTSDFVIGNLIPSSYLTAGRITFEGDDGAIYWSLSFGGAAYTGPTAGLAVNDLDGEFGPAFGGALPSSDLQSLLFQGSAADPSSSNLLDYAFSSGPAVFSDYTGATATVVPEPPTVVLLTFGAWALTRRRPTSRRS